MTQPTGHRRIDRVLAPDYLADLPSVPIEQVRRMRRDAEQEETDLSYLRRLLQGRMDILRSELRRRDGDTGEPAMPGDADASLVDRLAAILADDEPPASPRGLGRHIAVEPSRADSHRRHVEALVADVDLSDTSSHDTEDLRRLLEQLEAEERRVSEQRRAVQSVMDACTAEIARRYRDGDADVAGLLPSERS